MNKHLIVLIGLVAALMLGTGCGKKGPLEPPSGAAETPEVDQTVVPMDNPSITPKWPGTGAPSTGSRY